MSIEKLEHAIRCDVKAACGCTEPVTIALAACHAARQAGGSVRRLRLNVSTNLFKNAMEVGIPGTGGAHGIPLAAALGIHAPHPTPDLRLLSNIDASWLDKARRMVADGAIELHIDQDQAGLRIEAAAESDAGTGRAIIADSHENLTLLEKNGRLIHKAETKPGSASSEVIERRRSIADIPFFELYNALSHLTRETRSFLLEGVAMNRKVAEAGLQGEGSLNIGLAYRKLLESGWMGNDLINRAKLLTSAAVDARMSGCSLPVMTSAGSGNQGLTVTLPLSILAEQLRSSQDQLAEALALAHAVTSILKYHTGTLSAMCGCVVCAGSGLTAGAAHLLGGGIDTIGAAINNMVASITGIICDGAKVGCAVKLVCAVDAAFQGAFMAMEGLRLPVSNGVIGTTIEESLKNIGRIAAPGMLETDEQILAIMVGKPS
ncbi:MAG TPA: L-serine ammonia-lyase, iron-sulfur-dependent, subunit alpha [Candidatus Ozemobacteraceae bacterium]